MDILIYIKLRSSSIFLSMYKFKTLGVQDSSDPEKHLLQAKDSKRQIIIKKNGVAVKHNQPTERLYTSHQYASPSMVISPTSSQKDLLQNQLTKTVPLPIARSTLQQSPIKQEFHDYDQVQAIQSAVEESTMKVDQSRVSDGVSVSEGTSKQTEKESEKAIQYLHESLQKLRGKNTELVQQNNELKVEVGNCKKLNEQYQVEKQYLLTEMRRIRSNASSLQAQKLLLFSQVSNLKNKIANMDAQIKIHEDQIWSLNNQNKKMIDELNFEREIGADYQKQNIFLKGEIMNYQKSFQNVIEEVKVMRSINKSEEGLNTKLSNLREQISQFRLSIQTLEHKEQQNIQLKKKINEATREMQAKNEKLYEQINFLKRQRQTQKDLMNESLYIPHDQFLQSMKQKEEKITELVQQNTELHKRNKQLEAEVKQASFVNLLAPRLHTNSNYVTKLVKESQLEVNQIKMINQNLHEELGRMRENYEDEVSISRNKSEEIDRLNIMLRHERNNRERYSQQELTRLSSDKLSLQRKVDQLLENQKSLRAQILEKDRIIMAYVQKQKAQKSK